MPNFTIYSQSAIFALWTPTNARKRLLSMKWKNLKNRNSEYKPNSNCKSNGIYAAISYCRSGRTIIPYDKKQKNLLKYVRFAIQKVESTDIIELKIAPAAGFSQKKIFLKNNFIFIVLSQNENQSYVGSIAFFAYVYKHDK